MQEASLPPPNTPMGYPGGRYPAARVGGEGLRREAPPHHHPPTLRRSIHLSINNLQKTQF